jgi:predicted Rossmann fold flavoprotein
MSKRTVVIIGAGAAGLMAAGSAAEAGARVIVLERNTRVGRKLRICGKGRANVTNIADVAEFVTAFGPNGRFLYGAFSRFFRDDLIALLESLGVPCKVERGGRVFPQSDDADHVADALERRARSLGAVFRMGARARRLALREGRIAGVELEDGEVIPADSVILATGGITYPATGSTGDGYQMAAEAGHTVVKPRHALTAMNCAEKWVLEVAGLSLRNVQATVFAPEHQGQKPVGREFGEMCFTHRGVSGPIILTLSRRVVDLVGRTPLTLSIDLKPALTREQLEARLQREMAGSNRHLRNYLPTLLPRSLARAFPGILGLDEHVPLNRVTREQRQAIIEGLKALRLSVVKLAPPEEAIVTAGGVAIGEVDPRTMQSRIIQGLYLAGEVLDIDGTTGGYNLQAAFSTGWVAGRSAAQGAPFVPLQNRGEQKKEKAAASPAAARQLRESRSTVEIPSGQ